MRYELVTVLGVYLTISERSTHWYNEFHLHQLRHWAHQIIVAHSNVNGYEPS